MIVLPQPSLPAIKQAPPTHLVDVAPLDCLVLPLALEYEQLVLEWFKDDARGYRRSNKKRVAEIETRLDQIEDEASLLSPQSAQGAAFQIKLASRLTDMVRNGATEVRQDYAEHMSLRLLSRTLEIFGTASSSFPRTSEYLMGLKNEEAEIPMSSCPVDIGTTGRGGFYPRLPRPSSTDTMDRQYWPQLFGWTEGAS